MHTCTHAHTFGKDREGIYKRWNLLRFPRRPAAFCTYAGSVCKTEREWVCTERDAGEAERGEQRQSVLNKIASFGLFFNLPAYIWLAYACAYICELPLCVHASVCMCMVLLPYNCSNDMSSTKKNSKRVEWNAHTHVPLANHV